MTQSRLRDVRITICGIHKTEFQGTSCPKCLKKMYDDYQALKKIPLLSKSRRWMNHYGRLATGSGKRG